MKQPPISKRFQNQWLFLTKMTRCQTETWLLALPPELELWSTIDWFSGGRSATKAGEGCCRLLLPVWFPLNGWRGSVRPWASSAQDVQVHRRILDQPQQAAVDVFDDHPLLRFSLPAALHQHVHLVGARARPFQLPSLGDAFNGLSGWEVPLMQDSAAGHKCLFYFLKDVLASSKWLIFAVHCYFDKDFSSSLIFPDTLPRNGLWGLNPRVSNRWWNRKYAAEFLMPFCCEHHKCHSVRHSEPQQGPKCSSKQQTALIPCFRTNKHLFEAFAGVTGRPLEQNSSKINEEITVKEQMLTPLLTSASSYWTLQTRTF